MAHSGVNAALRAKRLAKRLEPADFDYYTKNVEPVLRAEYASLQEKGYAHFNQSFDTFMDDLQTRTKYAKNITYSDVRAFIYPGLNQAHRDAGENGVRLALAPLVQTFNEMHNRHTQTPEGMAHFDLLVSSANKLVALQKKTLVNDVKKILSRQFNKAELEDEIIGKCHEAVKELSKGSGEFIRIWTAEAANVLPYAGKTRAHATANIPEDYVKEIEQQINTVALPKFTAQEEGVVKPQSDGTTVALPKFV